MRPPPTAVQAWRRRCANSRRAFALMLFSEREGELVLRRRLPCHPRFSRIPQSVIRHTVRRILVQRENCRIVPRRLVEHSADPVPGVLHTVRRVEPQLVFPDRPTKRWIEPRNQPELVWGRKSAAAEIVRNVAVRHGPVYKVGEYRTAISVAPILRYEIDPHASFCGFGGNAGNVDRHLLCRSHVGGIERVIHAGREVDRKTVNRDALIEGAAAVGNEQRHRIAAGPSDILWTAGSGLTEPLTVADTGKDRKSVV